MRDPSSPTAAERAHFTAVARAMEQEKRNQLKERQGAAGQLGLRLRWLTLERRAD
jgi:hypothetical protein